ncbi:hypothetical protein OIK44_24130 [Janthinobacterium sp. hw3]|uniref:Uncharacterized protein n=1 Tax=Janthinobacterium fluminis TaxID=2987524 RepID=A0ABT5K700_9BURK|nr:hypothetical protein [Janthinobacterium fluminis]
MKTSIALASVASLDVIVLRPIIERSRGLQVLETKTPITMNWRFKSWFLAARGGIEPPAQGCLKPGATVCAQGHGEAGGEKAERRVKTSLGCDTT